LLLAQHPVQLPVLHGAWQVRLSPHTWPSVAQLVHAAPADPQAESWPPGTHTLFAQQPLGHVAGPHVAAVHCPLPPHDWPRPAQF
jgi:hypothetical protein